MSVMPTIGTPESLCLPAENEVHVWTVRVTEYSDFLIDLQRLLSPAEAQAAGRFVYPADRVRYIVAHGVLRQLLSEYLGTPAQQLVFVSEKYGKPSLASMAGPPPLRFNLSHSGDLVLYGITRSRAVGVDVEAIRPDIEIMDLAKNQFSAKEMELLGETPHSDQTDAFFRCWTRKEAYLKARGEGLGYPLDRFTVELNQEDRPKILWVEDDPDAPERWSLLHLNSLDGYAGAVAVEGQGIELVAHDRRIPLDRDRG